MNAAPLLMPRALVLTALLTLAACVSVPPPVSDLVIAQQSIARAQAVEAEQYADEDFSRAQRLITQAQTAMVGGQNDEARQLAWRATASADLAAARSRSVVALATLRQRQGEVAELRRRLQQEPLP